MVPFFSSPNWRLHAVTNVASLEIKSEGLCAYSMHVDTSLCTVLS